MQIYSRIALVSLSAVTLILNISCLGKSGLDNEPINQQQGDQFDGDIDILPGNSFGIELSSAPDYSANLGSSNVLVFALEAADQPVAVNLTVERVELDGVLPVPGEVVTSLQNAVVNLQPGQQSVQTLTLNIDTHAPSGFLEHFHIRAISGATDIELSVNLTVNAVFRVTANNTASPANWTGLSVGQTRDFRAHPSGLRVEFLNNTGLPHWTHADSTGAISGCNHQSTNGAASGIPANGMYVMTLSGAGANTKCEVYRHGSGTGGENAVNNEGAANKRTILYNVP